MYYSVSNSYEGSREQEPLQVRIAVGAFESNVSVLLLFGIGVCLDVFHVSLHNLDAIASNV